MELNKTGGRGAIPSNQANARRRAPGDLWRVDRIGVPARALVDSGRRVVRRTRERERRYDRAARPALDARQCSPIEGWMDEEEELMRCSCDGGLLQSVRTYRSERV